MTATSGEHRYAVRMSLIVMATETHAEPNQALSWAVGAGALVILLALMAALVAFGGGREHS